jgi:diguanylate cyclase (GGDEF)-like protein
MTDVQGPPPRAKILIVDDSKFNLTVLNGLLKDENDIMVATGGAQGLKAAAAGCPDLILLDIHMPEMDGYEVFNRLKADPATRDIPVVFITALSEGEDEAKGLQLGAADYIAKPFNPIVVQARVRTQLRLKRQTELLASYAFKDGLTGVANRRAFNERLHQEWGRCIRGERELSAILLDVDHFKLYNDHYGHAHGDECLRAVARALAGQMRRAGDFVARYGGEEFVVLAPETSLEHALQLAERLRVAVQDSRIEHAKSITAAHVSISLGVASTIPRRGSDALPLIELADKMLYQSKSSGRNQAHGAGLSV